MTEPLPWTFAGGGAYSEELAWLTDVLRAPATGHTQHRRLREDPRTAIAFEVLASGDDRRWLEAQLRMAAGQPWDAPVDIDTRALTAPVAAAATMLPIEPVAGARYQVGGRVLIVGDAPRPFEVGEIDAIGTDSVTLVAGTLNAWPAGTHVIPLREARVSPFPVFGRFTADASALVRVQFQLAEALDLPAAWAATLYRGFPVFDFCPAWTTDPSWAPDRLLEAVDNEMAAPAVFDLADVSLDAFGAQYVLAGVDEVGAFRSALWSLAGRAGAAWLPTWTHDVRLVAAVGNGASTIDVAGPLLSATELATNRRDLRLELFDGTVLHRRVTAAADLSGGIERLTLGAPIASGFGTGDLAMACFMQLCTQAADVNLLRYFDRTTLVCELTWKGLAHDV